MKEHRKKLSFWGALGVLSLLSGAADIAAAPPQPGGPNRNQAAWSDDFSALDPNRWVIATGRAPGYLAGNHIGYYESGNVALVDGKLSIRLSQQTGTVDGNPSGVISHGGLIFTRQTYGYGTYEWRMRMSSTAATSSGLGSPVAGSVSAGFIYVDNSKTEIDFEFETHLLPGWLWMANWYNKKPRTAPTQDEVEFSFVSDPQFAQKLSAEFVTYKFVWQEGSVTSYLVDENGNNVFLARHVTNVPRAPAYFMINHWGTNSPWFGGLATTTPGNERYFYVDWVRYTPLP